MPDRIRLLARICTQGEQIKYMVWHVPDGLLIFNAHHIMVIHGSTTEIPTPPSKPSERDLRGIRLAIEEAKLGFEEGGIPSS